jgi:hypothetical protein
MPLVENAAALTKIFGKWPTFHDAEVLRIVLDRAGDDGPTIEAQIHVFAMTSRVDDSGRQQGCAVSCCGRATVD